MESQLWDEIEVANLERLLMGINGFPVATDDVDVCNGCGTYTQGTMINGKWVQLCKKCASK